MAIGDFTPFVLQPQLTAVETKVTDVENQIITPTTGLQARVEALEMGGGGGGLPYAFETGASAESNATSAGLFFTHTFSGTTGAFGYVPAIARLSQSEPPTTVANQASHILTKYDADNLYVLKSTVGNPTNNVSTVVTDSYASFNASINGTSRGYLLLSSGRLRSGTTFTTSATNTADIMTKFDTDDLYAVKPKASTVGLGDSSPASPGLVTRYSHINTKELLVSSIRNSSSDSAEVVLSSTIIPSGGAVLLGTDGSPFSSAHIDQISADTRVTSPDIRSNGFRPVTAGSDFGTMTNYFGTLHCDTVRSYGSNVYMGNVNSTQLIQMSGGGSWRPMNEGIGAADLGASSQRWRTLFSTTSVNVSSDEDLKQDIAEIPQTLLDVWFDHVSPCQYKMKADPDGNHIGYIAQDIIAAFDAAGLDWHEYHVVYENQELISEDYTAEDAEKFDYYSVNYAAAQLIEAMAVRQRLSIKPSKRFEKKPWYKFW